MKHNVKVSIISITYNQERYIAQAIDSFIKQKTNFSYEIIIADDASTDNTQKIISQYKKNYPHLFNIILRKKNIGVTANLKDALMHAKGEYIALCEGDDYWTDSSKLQKQANFLDKNKSYSMCFHPVLVFFENSKSGSYTFPNRVYNFTKEALIKDNFIQTNSVMYRALDDYSVLATNLMPYDWYIHLFHAQYGKIGFINKNMSAYRRHPGGVWWNSRKRGDIDNIWKTHGVGHVLLYLELLKIYGHFTVLRKIIDDHLVRAISTLAVVDSKNNTNLIDKIVMQAPSSLNYILSVLGTSYSQKNIDMEKIEYYLHECESRSNSVTKYNSQLKDELELLRRELTQINKSKDLKIGRLVLAPLRLSRRIITQIKN